MHWLRSHCVACGIAYACHACLAMRSCCDPYLVPPPQVTSNVDRGPLARKRDVGFIYHTNKMRELQRQAAELEVEFPYPKQVGA